MDRESSRRVERAVDREPERDRGVTPPAPELIDLFRNDPDRVGDAVRSALDDRSTILELPAGLAADGLDADRVLRMITPYLRGGGRDLGDPGFLAHMDPPTPWITWVAALLGASSNQNLLHPDTAPAARQLEATVVAWISPLLGMAGGHLTPGSTVANLTALWAARELTGAETVVASTGAHLSIRKAASILGLRYLAVEPAPSGHGSLAARDLAPVFGTAGGTGDPVATTGPDRAKPAATIVVLTAGTTGVGAIDELGPGPRTERPAWIHVDAAWAGPMRFSSSHAHRLDGIEFADSVAVSAHKWLHQPKESALVLFNDLESANRAISLDGAYLQVPNVGLLGSHGTAAAPLATTLLHLGRDGVGRLIDHCMAIADELVAMIEAEPALELYGPNVSGVVVWRHRRHDSRSLQAELRGAFVSTVDIGDTVWLRSVAANPMAEPARVVDAVLAAADRLNARRS